MNEVAYFVTSMKEEMKAQGVSVAELSRRSGIPYATLYDLASGRTNPEKMTVDTAVSISCALGTTVDELVGRLSEPLSAAERELVDGFRRLGTEQRALVMSMVAQLAER